jgi:riboflavin kinase/FMN adenylyltransferase
MTGTVERGDRRGRGLGFPTANLATQHLAPADGVYGGTAVLEDGREFVAAISVGSKPTFQGRARTVEAFLMGPEVSGAGWRPIPGLPEYGWRMRLRVEHWVREQIGFESVESLVEQMRGDCRRVLELCGREVACP